MGFKIERAPDADGVPGAWTQIATLDPPAYYYGSYTDTNRAASTTYWYRVRAFNWIGDSPYSAPAVVTILPPATPSALTALGLATRIRPSCHGKTRLAMKTDSPSSAHLTLAADQVDGRNSPLSTPRIFTMPATRTPM